MSDLHLNGNSKTSNTVAKLTLQLAQTQRDLQHVRCELYSTRRDFDSAEADLRRANTTIARLRAEVQRFRSDALKLAATTSHLGDRYIYEVQQRIDAEEELDARDQPLPPPPPPPLPAVDTRSTVPFAPPEVAPAIAVPLAEGDVIPVDDPGKDF